MFADKFDCFVTNYRKVMKAECSCVDPRKLTANPDLLVLMLFSRFIKKSSQTPNIQTTKEQPEHRMQLEQPHEKTCRRNWCGHSI